MIRIKIMKREKTRVKKNFRSIILRSLMIVIILSVANTDLLSQTVVNSLTDLKPFLSQDNVNVKLTPGTYSITASDVANGLYPDETDVVGRVAKVLLLFKGNNSTYDFTDVTINVETAVFQAYGSVQVYEIQIIGSDNVLNNLTLVDDGSVYDRPTSGALNICIDGARNRIEGFHVTAKGSYPYGYGDAFGKGGTNNIIGHKKHSACLIRGESNHLKNCTFIHRTYGHCIFMQAANNARIEGCYVEGEVRSTDEMLAEEGTGSPADNVGFMTTWGYKLPAGYMMSTGEEGIRAYNGGETVIDGVEYERGTSNPTVLNCTIKYMRSGVNLPHASGTKYVEGCIAIGCEQGFAVGSGDIVNCSADATYGPIYKSTYNSDKNVNAEITILPAIDPYHNGSKCIAYIGGSSKNIILRNSESNVNKDLIIQMGGDFRGVGLLEGNAESQNNHSAVNITIDNFSGYPIILPASSSGVDGQSCGPITNDGSGNNMAKVSCETECYFQLNVDAPSDILSGIQYKYYEGVGDVFPDFNTLDPIKVGSLDGLSLSPAESEDNYGFRFEGHINIASKGEYTFYTTSNDGSKLYVDGSLVVNGSEGGAEVSGDVCLEEGYHEIKIEFFKGTSENYLSVMYQGEGFEKTELSDFYYNSYSVRNLALEGTATQSSTDYNGPPELAIDGNTDGNFGNNSVTHTSHNDAIKWWQVDLGEKKLIEQIVIYNRTGSTSYSERLNNFTVEVLSGEEVIFSQFYAAYPNPFVDVATDGVIGQIVKISKTSADGLTLAEVQVFGRDVAKLDQTISFNELPLKQVGDVDFSPGATASSNLEVSYMSSNSDVATIVEGEIRIVGVGTTIITASQIGNEDYNAAASVSQTLTVRSSNSEEKQDQVITFDALPTKKVGDSDFSTGASASSGLTILFSSSDSEVAIIVNDKIQVVGAGTSTITAMQLGDDTYNSASASQVLTVEKISQTINFEAFSVKKEGDVDFSPEATTTSGLSISYSSSNTDVAVVEDGMILILEGGTTIITASQSGDDTYLAAGNISHELYVMKIQTITFDVMPVKEVGDEAFSPGATSNSGLSIIYTSSDTDVATIVEGNIHIVGAGISSITASQTGNEIYIPAEDVSQNLAVLPGVALGSDNDFVGISVYPNPVSDVLLVRLKKGMYKEYIIYGIGGEVMLRDKITSETKELNIDFKNLSNGVYLMVLTGKESAKTFKLTKK